ncbi:GNAT family N-acetyltransferase [Pedobacter cryoconitis]|uniref:Ribosomal protein S18 acetylase RimI-like enzyme n=1 Tax=Pedobacter cryoconitis TaxID=188932 RepID=A0A7X0J6M4_9SPHI|nr:GNAT family N-acetyltransferase [Pedobacter cryoconitis]MBB6502075.1 ribosomal protein S18 acetylase RimI-like enzyme [Pedobacter cryoconitis]
MIQEEKTIINNLFEFWNFVGNSSQTILFNPDFNAVIPGESDWPKRVFNLGNGTDPEGSIFKDLSVQIRENKLPDMLTLTASMGSHYKEELTEAGFKPKLKQLGMIIDLAEIKFPEVTAEIDFRAVENAGDADCFASIASQSFKYKVDGRIVASLLHQENSPGLFIGYETDRPVACGLIFYDQYGFAGLHMIGTLPEFRGRGMAAGVTVHLLKECIKAHRKYCVLHASAAGERIYSKLGFRPVEEINTYSLAV